MSSRCGVNKAELARAGTAEYRNDPVTVYTYCSTAVKPCSVMLSRVRAGTFKIVKEIAALNIGLTRKFFIYKSVDHWACSETNVSVAHLSAPRSFIRLL